MEIIKDGILMGLALSLLTGPLLFAVLDKSIRHGKRAGLSLASGIWISDFIFVLVCYLSFESIKEVLTREFILTIIGPIGIVVLLGMGIHHILTAIRDSNKNEIHETKLKKGTKRMAWVKGFTLNVFNPFTILFWIGMVIYFSTDENFIKLNFLKFVIAMLLTIISVDVLKVILAGNIRNKLAPKTLILIKSITGIIFLLSGIVLTIKVILEIRAL